MNLRIFPILSSPPLTMMNLETQRVISSPPLTRMNAIKYCRHTKHNMFPIRKFNLMKMNDFRQIKEKVLKEYIVVVIDQDYNIVKNTFDNLDIIVLNKTYVEKYLIYSVKMDPYSIKSLKENSWCVNISKGI